MRLSSSLLFSKNMQSVVGAQSNWQKVAQQLASGKRILSPSDDPLSASQIIVLKQSQARNDQYQSSRKTVESAHSFEDSVLSGITGTLIPQIKETLVRASSGVLSDADRDTLALTLQNYKDQLVALGNTTSGDGVYIFAGYKSDTPPFVVDPNTGDVNYVGGSDNITLQIDANREVLLHHTGTDIFLRGSGAKEPDGTLSESDIFKSLDYAINSLKTPLEGASDAVVQAALDELGKAQRGIDNSMDNISSVRAELGVLMNEVETLKTIGTELNVVLEDQISNLEGADAYKTISDYYILKVTLEAAQQTFLDIRQISIFNLLR